jgi:DNA-binding XRE family transcriptional regulator
LLKARVEVAREHPGGKRAITTPANGWLDQLMRKSAAFAAKVAEGLAAINVAQDFVRLREARGFSQAQLGRRARVTRSVIAQLESGPPGNVELRTLVRVAAALGARLDVSIRPCRTAEPASQARPGAKRRAALRSRARTGAR